MTLRHYLIASAASLPDYRLDPPEYPDPPVGDCPVCGGKGEANFEAETDEEGCHVRFTACDDCAKGCTVCGEDECEKTGGLCAECHATKDMTEEQAEAWMKAQEAKP